MKNKLFIIQFCLLAMLNSQAQFANITQNNVQIPQLTSSQLAALPSPQKGMLAYNLTSNCLSYYDGSQWKCSDIAKSNAGLKTTISQPLTGAFLHYAHGLTTDTNEFTYISGSFSGTSISLCDTVLTASAPLNMFFAKLNAKGCLVWAKAYGTSGWNEAYDITTDATGNVYVTGHFTGTINFGNGNLTSAGGSDIFVAKYNSTGVFQWVQQGGGISNSYEYGYGVALDGSQNVYIVGSFRSNATFGAITLISAGDEDIFVAKYDNNGTLQWANSVGGTQKDFARDIAINATNDVFVVGTFNSSFNYGGTVISPPFVGASDAFIAKYDVNGTVSWAKRGGGNYADFGNSVAVDGTGNAYLAGGFADNATFGTVNIAANGSNLDAFVAKYNSSGLTLWVSKAGGVSDDEAKAVFVDAIGNAYLTGYYSATPFFGTIPAKPFGMKDYFAAKFDNSGFFQWLKNGGGNQNDSGMNISKSGSKILVFGTFSTTGFFDKNIITSSNGNPNVFLQKIEE